MTISGVISEITIAELKYGTYKSNRTEENLNLIRRFLDKVNIVSFGESIDVYTNEKNLLYKSGQPIEDFDLLIASAAKARGLVLVTDNVKHFKNVSDLDLENWVER